MADTLREALERIRSLTHGVPTGRLPLIYSISDAALSAPPAQEPLFLARQAARHALQFLRDPTHQGDGHLDQCIASLEAVLDTEPKAITPPGVELGSGHECAAAIATLKQAVKKYSCTRHKPLRSPLCAHCQMAARIEEVVDFLAHPCPSPLTREEAEKLAEKIIPPGIEYAHPDVGLRTKVADALQSVAGSEDTRLQIIDKVRREVPEEFVGDTRARMLARAVWMRACDALRAAIAAEVSERTSLELTLQETVGHWKDRAEKAQQEIAALRRQLEGHAKQWDEWENRCRLVMCDRDALRFKLAEAQQAREQAESLRLNYEHAIEIEREDNQRERDAANDLLRRAQEQLNLTLKAFEENWAIDWDDIAQCHAAITAHLEPERHKIEKA